MGQEGAVWERGRDGGGGSWGRGMKELGKGEGGGGRKKRERAKVGRGEESFGRWGMRKRDMGKGGGGRDWRKREIGNWGEGRRKREMGKGGGGGGGRRGERGIWGRRERRRRRTRTRERYMLKAWAAEQSSSFEQAAGFVRAESISDFRLADKKCILEPTTPPSSLLGPAKSFEQCYLKTKTKKSGEN